MEITEELVKSLTKEQYKTFSKEDKKEIQRIKSVLRSREYYKKNPEKNGYRKDYYHKNRNKIINRNKNNIQNLSEEEDSVRKTKQAELMRNYRSNNIEHVRSTRKKNYYKNRNKILSNGRRSYKKNKEKYKTVRNTYRKNRRKNDIEFKLRESLRSRFKKFIFGKISSSELFTCDDVSIIKRHLETNFKQGMSWGNYGQYGWHIDHIIPLSSFDLTNEVEVKIAFHYLNLQPLWAEENLKKGNKIPKNIKQIRKLIVETINLKT